MLLDGPIVDHSKSSENSCLLFKSGALKSTFSIGFWDGMLEFLPSPTWTSKHSSRRRDAVGWPRPGGPRAKAMKVSVLLHSAVTGSLNARLGLRLRLGRPRFPPEFTRRKKTSDQSVQLDKTNILLNSVFILDKYNLSSGEIELSKSIMLTD